LNLDIFKIEKEGGNLPFVEICEKVSGVNNTQWDIKFIRLIIRYITRLFGYKNSGVILIVLEKIVIKFQLHSLKKARYINYLININRFRVNYLEALSTKNLIKSVEIKITWAEYSIRHSMSSKARFTARQFLTLLANYGMYTKNISKINLIKASKISNENFYIYGPNANNKPLIQYSDYTIIYCKPIDNSEFYFRKNMLFLNSIYYRSKVSINPSLKSDLEKKYNQIFVSCRESNLEKPFIRSLFPIGDSLASSMALGRILYNLIRLYGKFNCVIEGFDFYLESETYKPYYPTLTKDSEDRINEQRICKGLADHDAVYNFLYVKHLLQNINLIDSAFFKDIIQLNANQYLEKLNEHRDFSSLNIKN
jgi:hypothetical protein